MKEKYVEISVTHFPEYRRRDAECYRKAIRKISKPGCAIIAVPDNQHREIAGFAMEEGAVLEAVSKSLADDNSKWMTMHGI